MKSFWFALSAVAMWSVAATIVGLMRVDTGSLVVAFYASAAGAGLMAAIVIFKRRVGIAQLISGLDSRDWLMLLAAGLSICFYELSFIYAIKNTPRVEAYMINYLWPIFSIGFFRAFLDREKRRRLGVRDWGFFALSFLGSSLMFVPDLTLESFSSHVLGYAAATCAAVLGGLNDLLGTLAKRRIFRLAHAESDAFACALGCSAVISTIVLGLVAGFTNTPLTLPAFDLFVACIYGFFVITLGRVAWLYALEQSSSYSLASLAYLTPVLGVIMLKIFLHDRILPPVLLGIAVIVASNFLLHAGQVYASATIGTFVSFLVTGFFIYATRHVDLSPDSMIGAAAKLWSLGDVRSDVIALVGGLFSILAGFTLTRVASINREQETLHIQIGESATNIWAHARTLGTAAGARNALDDAMRAVVDFDVAVADNKSGALDGLFARVDATMASLDTALGTPPDGVVAEVRNLRDRVQRWAHLRLGRLSAGELFALLTLGALNVAFYLSVRPDSFVGDLSALAFASAVVFLLLTIRDYDRNRPSRGTEEILFRQRSFVTLGTAYYLPAEMLDGAYLEPPRKPVRVRCGAPDGSLTERTLVPDDRVSVFVRWIVVALSVGAVLVLLLSGRLPG